MPLIPPLPTHVSRLSSGMRAPLNKKNKIKKTATASRTVPLCEGEGTGGERERAEGVGWWDGIKKKAKKEQNLRTIGMK